MNPAIISSPAQPQLFGYISAWSQLPLRRFEASPLSAATLPTWEKPTRYEANRATMADRTIGATEHFIKSAQDAFTPLLVSLQLKAGDLEEHLAEGRNFASFFEQPGLPWLLEEGESQFVRDDLAELHIACSDARSELIEWRRRYTQYTQVTRFGEVPEALQVQLRRLQGGLAARISLARRAMSFVLPENDDDSSKIMTRDSLRKGIGAFFNVGMRVEYTVLPVKASWNYYHSGQGNPGCEQPS